MIKVLLPLAWIYGGIMAIRNWMFDKGHLKQTSFTIPVISVGNLAVGGTGKTPHTEYLLRLLSGKGFKCAMLSRGYGRKTQGFYPAKGNGPQEIGDEPWQVQQKFPEADVFVCEKRVVGIQNILSQNERPQVILLDDAYQHRYVHPGLSILLTDYSHPYYKDEVLPAGRLREFRKGAKRADIIIVTKCPESLGKDEQKGIVLQLKPLPAQNVFFTYFSYGELYSLEGKKQPTDGKKDISDAKVLLLCGIARPESLINHLQPRCKDLTLKDFPDHHNFTAKEITKLGEDASNYDIIITTEKDAARLSSYALPEEIKERLWIQPIEVKFINQESYRFNNIIENYVTENSRNSKMD